ncbi:Endonuclease/exonuclease/phosphatase, partial [Suillus clintonianus]|uniref:Endonuclease/exonuclease/phosphatase n=1 Tax=Suillus clintonianus TaxID=1904413 RepID=UPI001B86BCA4
MDDTNNEPPARNDLRIWQQNLRKSLNAWEHMLKNLDPESFDIACIQEPYFNPVNLANASNLGRFWDVVYPTNHHSQPDRSKTLLLVNKRLSKNHWHIVPIHSPNVMAIEILGPFGKVRIYNIYNQCDNDSTL